MLFCTTQYVYFLAAVAVVHWLLPWHRARIWLLLAASIGFYASWNKWLALLVVGTSVCDFGAARAMDSTRNDRLRRGLLMLSLLANLGMLITLKYANFFLDSLREGLALVGVTASLPVLSVLVPVGISFYTFEAINYVVDVYRRRIPAERRPDHFLLFILFFPHLVAGPIVRARDFLPQLNRPRNWSWPRAWWGIWLLVLGAFKKLVLGDRMAVLVDPVFADPGLYSSEAVWTAAVAFAIQIYSDFSGYSDMALGSAHLLGYKLRVNFQAPFLAANVGEFWRRWHISLSTWLRDYVFIPLGGSRAGGWRTARNLVITMTLGGLWHGAYSVYVFWGTLQGVLLAGHRLFADWARKRPRLDRLLSTRAGWALRVAVTAMTFVLCCALFRCMFPATVWIIFGKLFAPCDGHPAPLYAQSLWFSVAALGVEQIAVDWFVRHRTKGYRLMLDRIPAPALGLLQAAILTTALLLQPGASKAFIYFQF